MSHFLVFRAKTLLLGVITFSILLTLCFLGNSTVDKVIETASNRLLPIYSVETSEKNVALTFDCAWRS